MKKLVLVLIGIGLLKAGEWQVYKFKPDQEFLYQLSYQKGKEEQEEKFRIIVQPKRKDSTVLQIVKVSTEEKATLIFYDEGDLLRASMGAGMVFPWFKPLFWNIYYTGLSGYETKGETDRR